MSSSMPQLFFSQDHRTPLKAKLLSRVSHNVVLVTDAAASQQSSNTVTRGGNKHIFTQGHITDASRVWKTPS